MDYGVPLPRGLVVQVRVAYPFRQMELRDSFLLAGEPSEEGLMRHRVKTAVAVRRCRGGLPKTFRVAMAWENGLRVWRVS